MLRTVLASVLAAVSLTVLAPAAQADWDTFRPFTKFPLCNEQNVYSRIQERFNWAERNTFNYGVTVHQISGGYEKGLVMFGPYAIPRRYCEATAYLSNGRKHRVYYRIEEGMGLAGTGYKVESCLPGYDRWRVYDGNCRVLRDWRRHR